MNFYIPPRNGLKQIFVDYAIGTLQFGIFMNDVLIIF